MTAPAAPEPIDHEVHFIAWAVFFHVFPPSGFVIGAEGRAEIETVVEADLLPADLLEIAAMLGGG